MRKLVAVLLSAITLTVGAPIVALAQAPTSTLRGQVVDAGGRGTADLRVELVSERMVIATTISTTDGHFSFAGVPAGNYVVRTNVNGQPTGVRASVTPGTTANALLVLPSLATAAPAVVVAALAPALGAMVSATVTTVANVIVVQAAKGNDEETVRNNVAAANLVIQQLNQQIAASLPPGTPAPVIPIFSFIPTTPASGAQ
jgi:hypothetical protein